jgi:hypothetical protein
MADQTSNLRVNVFDGSRQTIAPDVKILITITDESNKQLVRGYYRTGQALDLPFLPQGSPKTGQSGSLENRPTVKPGTGCFYRVLTWSGKSVFVLQLRGPHLRIWPLVAHAANCHFPRCVPITRNRAEGSPVSKLSLRPVDFQ